MGRIVMSRNYLIITTPKSTTTIRACVTPPPQKKIRLLKDKREDGRINEWELSKENVQPLRQGRKNG